MVVEPVEVFKFSSVCKELESTVIIADGDELGAVEIKFDEEGFNVGYSVFISECKELEYVLRGSVGATVEYTDVKSSLGI